MEDAKAFEIAEQALDLLIPEMPEDISAVLSHTESVVQNGKPHVFVFADNKLDALKLKEFFDTSVKIRNGKELHVVGFEVVMPSPTRGMN